MDGPGVRSARCPLATLAAGHALGRKLPRLAAAARLPIAWNRLVVLLTSGALLFHGAFENRWLAWPPVYGQQVYADASHHLRQSTHFTCGPAVSERAMAERCLTIGQGTRLFNLYRGLDVSIAAAPFDVSIAALPVAELLAPGRIAVAANSGSGHALCLVGRGDPVLVHDPLRPAPVSWSIAELERNYDGIAVLIEAR
jgi:hypothetical protein